MPPTRIPAIDVARGIAMVAMMVFHLGWDLVFFGLPSVPSDSVLFWLVFPRAIVSTFLLIAGMSFILAHGTVWRGRLFWRRLGVLGAAAGLITTVTWFIYRDGLIFFGVLHAMAAFSVLAIALRHAPAPALLGLAGLVLLVGINVRAAAFQHPSLIWLGLSPIPPASFDFVPPFPFLAPFLCGMAIGRLGLSGGWFTMAWSRWPAADPTSRLLRWVGRWSLPIYLLHQPILLIAVFALAAITWILQN